MAFTLNARSILLNKSRGCCPAFRPSREHQPRNTESRRVLPQRNIGKLHPAPGDEKQDILTETRQCQGLHRGQPSDKGTERVRCEAH